MGDVRIRNARADDLSELTQVLVRAFVRDPGLRWAVPSERDWDRHSGPFFTLCLRRVFGRGIVLTTDDRAGVATWVPPDAPRPGLRFQMSEAVQMVRMLGRRTPAGYRVVRALEAAHPREPHWYLDYLGTDPAHQGKGVGSTLVKPLLARCDADGLPAFVATTNEANLAFYGRHGFEVVGELRARWAPAMWYLRREPRSLA